MKWEITETAEKSRYPKFGELNGDLCMKRELGSWWLNMHNDKFIDTDKSAHQPTEFPAGTKITITT